MIYLSDSLTGESSMFFFGKKRKKAEASKEAQYQAIRKDTYKKIDKLSNRIEKTTKKVDVLLNDKSLGTTGFIFYATGGDRRNVGRRR